MSTESFEGITPAVADGLSRRASLLTAGAAALAVGVANASVADAKKKKNCKKKQNQRCNNDAAACRAQVPAACAGDPECIAEANLCCDTCSANGFLTCLLAAAGSAAGAVARLK